MKSILNRDGTPSPYGFACGYILALKNGESTVRMWREDGCYHIVFRNVDGMSRYAERTLTLARTRFRNAARSMRGKGGGKCAETKE